MVSNKSVIVVGAGASHEAGLPVGAGLKNDISHILKHSKTPGHYGEAVNDATISHALTILSSQGNDIKSLYQACEHISEAMPQVISIDNFIDTHKGNESIEKCGKLAIVRSILKAEKGSKLYVNLDNIYNKPNYGQLESTWFNAFRQLMTENCQAEELEHRFVSIVLIIFNYDRCIEHFLYYSLKNVYRLNDEQAANIVNNTKIYHPYGVVGNLPWQSNQDAIAFGDEPDHHLLVRLANKIKTFTEGTDPDSSEISEIRSSMLNAEIVLFLGFAFHKLNMQLITPDHSTGKGAKRTSYYATATGISDSDIDEIQKNIKMLSKSGNVSINLRNDRKCYEIFHEYKRSLILY